MKPPAPVVSWPMLPNAQRNRLVAVARRLTADSDLHQNDVAPSTARVELVGHRQPSVEALTLEHAPG